MTDIDQLRDRLKRLQAENESLLAQILTTQEQIRDAALADRGTSMGGIIKCTKNGELYKITKAEVWDFGDVNAVSVNGAPKLKNGTFGNRSQYVGTDWEPVPS